MEEENRLPKNIRQMAEKEERVRVYLEDYVYTFIHKMQCAEDARAGVLLGSRMMTENKRCWFVKGAVELEEPCTREGVTFTQELWEETQKTIQDYFSDCSVCGWFICGSDENFPDKELLKKTHLQVFSGENFLMYWKEGEEDCFWMEEEGRPVPLKGYYVYYEKNFQMQNYMVSRKEQPAESVDDQAARSFRKIMKEKKKENKYDVQLWMKAGAAAAVILLFAGAVALSGGITGKEEEGSVQALAVGASVERQSIGPAQENSGEDESGITDEETESGEYAEETGEEATQGRETKEDTGAQGEMETGSEENVGEKGEGKGSAVLATQGNAEAEVSSTSDDAEKSGEGAVAAGESGKNLFSGDMVFYKDGLGAAVYRITSAGSSAAEETTAVSRETENTVEAGVGAVNRPASYTVQPGDTLIEISMEFYGSADMVMMIKEANDLSDVNKIYIGQELVLP